MEKEIKREIWYELDGVKFCCETYRQLFEVFCREFDVTVFSREEEDLIMDFEYILKKQENSFFRLMEQAIIKEKKLEDKREEKRKKYIHD